MEKALLVGRVIASLNRRGKQIAVIAADEAGRAGGAEEARGAERAEGAGEANQPALCIHLGMTGSVIHHQPPVPAADEKHAHVIWQLDSGHCVYFHDPRRFGGIWCFPRVTDLANGRWGALGEDALTISAATLHDRLQRTDRHLKAALLDQSVIAGLGNIYVDELLFNRELHPMMRASKLKMNQVQMLVDAMRDLLGRAIASGGSSLRNYVDADGQTGGFQFQHLVYGRSGQSCTRCERTLKSKTIAGRTTVYCAGCQKR